ncbi:MAG TPA: extracellular solute-binding protein [bacterium]|nr:extracellular solute-binding protein [bacterium]HQP99507.1 extracellular solute-binding protein [bacterium]
MMMSRKCCPIGLFLPVLWLSALSSCSGEPAAEQQTDQSRKLAVVSPHNLHVKRELGAAFSRWYEARYSEAVTVDWLDQGGTSRCMRFVLSQFERTPAGIDVDLFFGGGIDPYLRLGSLGLLQPCELTPEISKDLPDSISGIPLRDPNGLWFGVALSTFGILINDAVVQRCSLPDVKTWTDLADPAVCGWVATPDPRSGGVAHMIFEIILQALGWEDGWATIMKLAGNSRYLTRYSSQIGKDVVSGEAAYGLLIDFYAAAQMRQGQPGSIRFVVPKGVSVMNPDALGILKGAPEPELAQRFVQFLLSPEGQRLWVLRPGDPGGPLNESLDRLPVLPSVYAEPQIAERSVASPYSLESTLNYNHELGGQRWGILDDLVGAVILDQHDLLRAAWRSMIEAGLPAEKVASFVRPPVDEKELLRLASDEWKDPVRKAVVMKLWTEQTSKVFQAILSSEGAL